MKNNINNLLVPAAPFVILIFIVYFFSKNKYKRIEVKNVSGYERQQTISNAITKKYSFASATFHDWGFRPGKLRLGSKIGMYATLISFKSLDTSTIDKLKEIFDTVEIDVTNNETIYTVKKYKVYFDTNESKDLIQKFDNIIMEFEKH